MCKFAEVILFGCLAFFNCSELKEWLFLKYFWDRFKKMFSVVLKSQWFSQSRVLPLIVVHNCSFDVSTSGLSPGDITWLSLEMCWPISCCCLLVASVECCRLAKLFQRNLQQEVVILFIYFQKPRRNTSS